MCLWTQKRLQAGYNNVMYIMVFLTGHFETWHTVIKRLCWKLTATVPSDEVWILDIDVPGDRLDVE